MTTSDAFLKHDQQSASIENERKQFEYRIDRYALEALNFFKQVTRQYALFHITFFSVAVLELIAFVLFFSFLTKTTIFAFSLAGVVLTIFTYFLLLFYFQAKKPEQLLELRNAYVDACVKEFDVQKGSLEYHNVACSCLERFLIALHRQEYTYYSLPASFQTLSPLMQKFSVWTHWNDLHQMKEILFVMIIKEHIEMIKLHPTEVDTHVSLANAYYALSKLYMDPRKRSPDENHLWVSPEYASTKMLEKFKRASLCAIEEYKIVKLYAPNHPWVHAQLAAIYGNLEQVQEQMREYEQLLKILPNDSEVLLRLGVLYFENGMSSQGLSLYEQLKNVDPSKAQELILSYSVSFINEW